MKPLPIILLTVASLAVSACHKDKKTATTEETPTVEVSPVIIDSVTVYKEYPGTLTADQSVEIVAEVSGTLSRRQYKGGDFVRKGQVLFTIQSDTYTNAVSEAEAALKTAISENEYAEQHYAAVAKAFESNAVSKMEVAQALSNRDQSRAAISSARARLDEARSNLAKCTIRAPFDGHITINEYSQGTYVDGEAQPVKLATIYDDAQVIANFAIEDASFQRMFDNPNNRHLINYDSIPINFSTKLPHSYSGKLYYLAPGVDASTGTMNIQAEIANPYNELRSGMYCTIRMPYKVEPKAMLVRDASISTDQQGKYLYLVNDSSKVVYTPIKVGELANDSMRIVNSGIKPGDRYVTSALLKVRNGMPVKTIE